MKSFIYTTLITLLFCELTYAQQQAVFPNYVEISENPNKEKSTNTLYQRAKDDITGWYNFGQELYDLGGNVDWIRNVLFPDSTVLVEFSGGVTGPVWKHSLGQVFDPTSGYFALDDPAIPAYAEYSLDSIRVYYRYNRFQTALPDTLVIQFYKEENLTQGHFGTAGQTDYYAYANSGFDHKTVLGTGENKKITYVLENKDIAESTSVLTFPVELNIDKGEVFGVTFTYFPGNPYNQGDTIDPLYAPAPANRINAFTIFEFRDKSKVQDVDILNNGMVARTSVRYNHDNQGWNGMYIPGQAFFNLTYHLDVDFHVTSLNVPIGIDEIQTNQFALFPNPVSDKISIGTSNDMRNVEMVIKDMMGRQILNEFINEFDQPVEIDVSSLKSGTYQVIFTTDNYVENILFIKN